jgi:Ran GTPase-activating protein (RanGAP) involved in mRNA processing and transport
LQGVGDLGAAQLATVLHKNTVLTALDLRHNAIAEDGASQLVKLLTINSHIISLPLGGNSRIELQTMSKVVDMLAKNKFEPVLQRLRRCDADFVELNLDFQNVGDEGAQWACEAMATNRQIRTISLRGNRVADVGAAHLAQAISRPSLPITLLDLVGNRIGDEGAAALAKVLGVGGSAEGRNSSGHGSITELRLGNNRIGNQGAAALGEGLASNEVLVGIDLTGNKIGDEGFVALGRHLQQNTTLRWLNGAHNILTDDGAERLTDMLRLNYGLEELNVRYNKLGLKGEGHLAYLLNQNDTIQIQVHSMDDITGWRKK